MHIFSHMQSYEQMVIQLEKDGGTKGHTCTTSAVLYSAFSTLGFLYNLIMTEKREK